MPRSRPRPRPVFSRWQEPGDEPQEGPERRNRGGRGAAGGVSRGGRAPYSHDGRSQAMSLKRHLSAVTGAAGAPRAAFLSTFPPTECGIATFTEDLVNAIDRVTPAP